MATYSTSHTKYTAEHSHRMKKYDTYEPHRTKPVSKYQDIDPRKVKIDPRRFGIPLKQGCTNFVDSLAQWRWNGL